MNPMKDLFHRLRQRGIEQWGQTTDDFLSDEDDVETAEWIRPGQCGFLLSRFQDQTVMMTAAGQPRFKRDWFVAGTPEFMASVPIRVDKTMYSENEVVELANLWMEQTFGPYPPAPPMN